MDNYIEYDALGLVWVKCMNCGKTVAQRTYTEAPDSENPENTVKIMTFQRLPNWRQQKFTVKKNGKDSGFIEPIVCDGCVDLELNPKELLKKIKQGWKAELKATGISNSKIDEKMKKYDGMEIE